MRGVIADTGPLYATYDKSDRGIQAALRFIEEINQGADLINLTIEDYQQAQQLLKRFPDQSITLFDASTAILSNRLSLPIWTYDRHFDIMRTIVWRD